MLAAKLSREAALKARLNTQLDLKEEAELAKIAKEKEDEEKKAAEGEGGEAPKEEERVEKPEPATERVAPKEPSVGNIDGDFKPTVLRMWQELSSNYKQQMKLVFRQVRVQRERISATLSHTQSKYLEFVHRPDIKQEKLD